MNETITLIELLRSRDERHEKHLQLLRRFPDCSLVSVTMVMPGPVKLNSITAGLAKRAESFLRSCPQFHIEFFERRDLKTGPEIYLLCREGLEATKRICCDIEDLHPLGRLWDFDVIRPDSVPMARTEIGRHARHCIVCGETAIDCIRGRRHSIEEIYKRVEEIYVANSEKPFELC